MNAEINKIITQYLSGELSAADRTVFEEKLKNNPELQQEVALQQSLIEAVKRSSTRTQVRNVSKSFHVKQTIKWTGISLVIATVLTALTILVYKQVTNTSENDLSQFEELIEKLKDDELINNLPSEFFAWNGADTAMLSNNGILISIPESAFFLNGVPYTDAALIQFQEALDATSIVKSGLSTESNGKLLETQGMFSFSAFTPDGEKLTINPKTGIYVQVPVDEYKSDMQLFTGVEGKDGIINWVNPKPLAKIPVPVDMNDLDFYPPGYEDSLNALKLRKDKKYRDSLYLSCEESNGYPTQGQSSILSDNKVAIKNLIPNNTKKVDWTDKITWSFSFEKIDESHAYIIGKAKIKSGWNLFSTKHDPNKAEMTGYPTKFSFPESDNFKLDGNLMDGLKPLTELSELGTHIWFRDNATFKQKIEIFTENAFSITFDYSFQICDWDGCIFPPDQRATVQLSGFNPKKLSSESDHIPPSNVLSFWKPAFNNTILSTREFEERMQAIHGTCDKKVLEVYTKNLNKPLSELDNQVAQMGYPNFDSFAAENIGALNPNNPHLKGLSAFYENGIKELREEVIRNRNTETTRRNNWDNKVQNERFTESMREILRENQAFFEEYNLNHKNVRKQLGRTLGMTIFTNAQICNIDRYVMETTIARKTGELFDKETGKTARIQYNDFSIEVANPENYDQLYVYLFPSELSSYQRIPGSNGKFTYSLNDAMIYDLAIVGISEKGYSYFQKSTFKEGKFGTVSLENVSEVKLNASIEQLNNNRLSKPINIKDELDWLIIEQKNYVEQRNRQDQFLFHERIKKIVFPCYEGTASGAAAASDTIVVKEKPFGI